MSVFALEWTGFTIGLVITAVLFGGLIVPYLLKEIRDGKRDLGPLRRLRGNKVEVGPSTPSGAGDINPGRVGDPAPGQPSGQADPYGERARRHAPPIQS